MAGLKADLSTVALTQNSSPVWSLWQGLCLLSDPLECFWKAGASHSQWAFDVIKNTLRRALPSNVSSGIIVLKPVIFPLGSSVKDSFSHTEQ